MLQYTITQGKDGWWTMTAPNGRDKGQYSSAQFAIDNLRESLPKAILLRPVRRKRKVIVYAGRASAMRRSK